MNLRFLIASASAAIMALAALTAPSATAQTDEEGYALLKAFGLPFKNAKND